MYRMTLAIAEYARALQDKRGSRAIYADLDVASGFVCGVSSSPRDFQPPGMVSVAGRVVDGRFEEVEVFKVAYICHPLRGKTPEKTAANRRRASELTALIAANHKIAPVCSWIVLSAHWTEEEGREMGLKIDCALIERCDELWLCGPVQPLSAGMQIERDHAEACGVSIIDKRGVYQ